MNLIFNSANPGQYVNLDEVISIVVSDDGNGNYYIYFNDVGAGSFAAFAFTSSTDRDTCLAAILAAGGGATSV